jgi:hypothetical protein
MIELKLQTKSPEQEALKQYLQENVSEILADKINKGVPSDIDGKPLINKKNLDGFMSYACDEAKKLAEKGAKFACIKSDTVFGWAVHYFEEDSIIGNLFYYDGTEYKPEQKSKPKNTAPTAVKVKEESKSCQLSLFDNIEANVDKTDNEIDNAIKGQVITEEGEIIDYEDFDGDVEETCDREDEPQETPSQKPECTPLYKRYKTVQDAYPKSVIAIRLGDFYEVFGEYAVELASEFDLTLTGRDCGLEDRVPMVGFPYHCADLYFKKINARYDLVIIESDKDSETRYLPRKDEKPDNLSAADNGAVLKLKALFGSDLEVK